MTKKILLLTTLILNSSLYSDTTTLKNGKIYHNAKVFHKGDTVTVSFECGKQIVINKSEISETEIKPLTRWKTQEECNQTEEEAKQAAEKRKEEEARRKEEKRLQEEQRRQELALKKQECEAKGDVWNGKDCRKKSVIPVIPSGGSGAIALNDGTVYQNAKFLYKGDTVIADFECGKQILFKQKEISKVQKGKIHWKTKEECNPKKEEDTGKWSDYQGLMNWEDAKAKCASIKMRLPTIEELRKAFLYKVTEPWEKDGVYYWSSTHLGDDRAYFLNILIGNNYDYYRNNYGNVRCLR
jgi:hypothetical protein